jgi:protein-disulfide isomerase
MASRESGRKRKRGDASKKTEQKPAIVAAQAQGQHLVALLGAAFVVCTYLTYAHYWLRHHLGWHSALGGAAHLSCDPVLLAPWCGVGPVPLSAIGMGLYAAAIVQLTRRIRHAEGVTASSATMVAIVGAFSTCVWLVAAIVSLATLHTVCGVSTLLALLGGMTTALARSFLRGSGRTILGSLERDPSNDPGQAMVVFVVAVILAIVLLAVYTQPPLLAPPLCEALAPGVVRPASEPPLQVIAYSDFRCEHCKIANDALRVIRSAPGIELVHRQVPWDRACNPEADDSARPGECIQTAASICAGKLGRYDAFSDRVFESGARARADLVKLAVELGLDPGSFERCLDADETAAVVREQIATAKTDGVTAIPTFIVGELKQRGFGGEEAQCFH